MKALSSAFRQAIRLIGLPVLIYGVTLVLGLLAALPFYNVLKVEDQNSLAFLKLLDGFDYTVFSDFMHRSKSAITPLISVGRWLGLLYLFLNLFFAGGILLYVSRFGDKPARFNVGLFGQACSQYVGRFLRLFGVTLLFVLISSAIWLLIGSLVGMSFSDTLTERGQFWVGAIFFTLFALTAILFLCIGDYAKVLMFREDERKAFRAFGAATRLVLRSPGRTIGLYGSLILIGAGLFGLYFLVDNLITMRNWPTILIMFVVQQSLIFARVILKVWALGTASNVYDTLPKPQPVLRSQPIIEPTQASAMSAENAGPTVE